MTPQSDLEAENERLRQERDAAFAMSKCECGPDECCANLVKALHRAERAEAALATARKDALEEAAKLIESHVGQDCGSYDGITIAQATKIADDENSNCVYAIRTLAQKEKECERG